MSTSKLFTVVGVSTLNGVCKVRFANDPTRVKVLAHNGHTDIVMIQLDEPSTKLDAALFIQELEEFANPVAQQTIADFIDAESGTTPKRASKKTASELRAELSAIEPDNYSAAESLPADESEHQCNPLTDMEPAPF